MNGLNNSDLECAMPGFNEAWLRLSQVKGGCLSNRESQVLILISNELKPAKIAELLGLKKTTIYKHLENARAKMNCNSLLSLCLKLSYMLNH